MNNKFLIYWYPFYYLPLVIIIMKKIILMAALCTSTIANAYNYFPLSPSWIGSLYSGITEDKRDLWRGTVKSIINPTLIIVEDTNEQSVEVNLLHLTPSRNATKDQIAISTTYAESLVGKTIYVLSKTDKKKVYAKLVDANGMDINLYFISIGAFDINTTSMFGKAEKQTYINASNSAKRTRIGIWN